MSNATTETVTRPIWRDRAAQISLGLAMLLNLLLFVLVLLAHQQLNEAMDAAAGAPDNGQAFNSLVLPIIGLVTWVIGGALGAFYYRIRGEAPMAYIIWAAVAFIQMTTWVPVLTMIVDL
jgi:hypothetical protein